ncbi:MAG: hypothetical protein IPJ04_18115 [Candidatus Eisenbacteria bacterium]|nr:hypothetical protein [Candidatus Eisenbacteria bacterium]
MRQTGDLMMRLNSNSVIRESLTSAAMTGLLDGLLVTGYLVVILLTHAGLGLLVLALGAVRLAVFAASQASYRELMSESAAGAGRTPRTTRVQLSIEGIETLKSSGAERRATEIWSNLFVDVLNVTVKRGRLSAVVDSLLLALETASPLVVLLVGAHLVLAGQLSLGTMLAVAALAGAFLHPLGSLVAKALEFQQLGSYVDRVEKCSCASPSSRRASARATASRRARARGRVVPLRRTRAARGRRREPHDRAGHADRDRRPVGLGQVHGRAADRGALLTDRRPRALRRRGPARVRRGVAAAPDRIRAAAPVPVRRHDPREHRDGGRARRTHRHRARGARGRSRGRDRGDAARVRDAARRGRHEPLGRPAPARRARAGSAAPGGAHARRGLATSTRGTGAASSLRVRARRARAS